MRQITPILNCNNNINSIISPAAVKPLLNLTNLKNTANLRHLAPSNPLEKPSLANAVFAVCESNTVRIIPVTEYETPDSSTRPLQNQLMVHPYPQQYEAVRL